MVCVVVAAWSKTIISNLIVFSYRIRIAMDDPNETIMLWTDSFNHKLE